uniref:Transcription elongation regulator 1-like protein n=1 Tax=Junco hyemalis TaxID=40217 RepID=A0A8C5JBF5_JUNHY
MLPAAAPRPPPLLWPPPAEPPAPPWAWVLPAAAGLLRVGAAAAGAPHPPPPPPGPPLLLPPPALLRPGPGWRGPAEPPLLPLLPAAAEPLLHGQWIFGAHSPVVGFSPSSSVELVPVLPPVYSAAVPPHAAKGWIEKRLPSCKIYLNNAFALDSAWVQPEESRLFQGAEKPLLLSNQVAMAVARPAAASRPLPTLVLAPQLIPGQEMMSPRAGTVTRCVPFLSPFQSPGSPELHKHGSGLGWAGMAGAVHKAPPAVLATGWDLYPRAALCSCSVCWLTPVCPQDHSFKLLSEADSAPSGNKPVASAPVPGSPWCVVWTGDDRVFFFNPSMQLSVWERPLDLRHRGDIKRLLEDPPHKRKLEAAPMADPVCVSLSRTEECQAAGPAGAEEEQAGEEGSAPRISPPLEERITHFRDMLLERGVSAFSTWEKELHKIVFDPRYLLLNPEERKQIFEQFVKTRVREEYKEKKNKLLLAKEEFKKLLEESKLSPRTTFKEFAEKHGRDQRFRLVPKKKDQEHFFNQFILILKKRDKENRIRLRKMR